MPTNRASTKVSARQSALATYMTKNHILVPPNGRMNELTARFSSFANTVQTRMNSSNGTNSSLGGTLEAQVDRALSQVLRQPEGGAGTTVMTRRTDTSIASMVGGVGGIQPVMSPYQASLLREARIAQADSLSILDSLQPISPFADPGDVTALQALVRAEINGLLEEFSYTRLLPRQERVRVYLGGLLGWNFDGTSAKSPFATAAPTGDIQTLVTLLNLGGPLVPTVAVEDQLASQQILGSDGVLFDSQWNNFWTLALQGNAPPGQGPTWSLWEFTPKTPTVPSGLGNLFPPTGDPPGTLLSLGPESPQLPAQAPWRIGAINNPSFTGIGGLSYAERMIQADLLLPVLAEDARRVGNSLAAIGFSSGEQETTFATFWSAVDSDLLTSAPVPPPTGPSGYNVLAGTFPIPVYMTVADILDWAQNLAGPTSSDQLRQAGALGLNLICDQADELFWLALAMLDPTASVQILPLADTEVQLEVSSLATDLNLLAKLAY
jgi:hypothetical protein